jgi:hypothetical protein
MIFTDSEEELLTQCRVSPNSPETKETPTLARTAHNTLRYKNIINKSLSGCPHSARLSAHPNDVTVNLMELPDNKTPAK